MRIAVLGCGSIGRRHLQNLRTLGQNDLLAFDPAPVVRETVRKDLGINCYATLDDVWEQKPDVALITAPSNRHVELALEAAQRGCHLFIEKPLSHSNEGLDELCAEAEHKNLTTMVGCNMRFHPGPATVKNLIDDETVGQITAARIQTGSYLPLWRPSQDYRQSYSAATEWGGAILDCIHEIDLALWYFGPATVACAACLPATAIGLETDGLAEILLRHNNGVLSNVHLNFVQRDYHRTCQIIGSEGTIYWSFSDHRVDVFNANGELAQSHFEPEGWQMNRMYIDELSHFLKCVENGGPTVNPIAGGLAALQVALAVRNSKR